MATSDEMRARVPIDIWRSPPSSFSLNSDGSCHASAYRLACAVLFTVARFAVAGSPVQLHSRMMMVVHTARADHHTRVGHRAHRASAATLRVHAHRTLNER
ncbi:hypothetical protein PG989_010913 [Apiospora arundinis]